MFWPQQKKQKQNKTKKIGKEKNLHNYLLFAKTKTGISQGKRE